MQTFDERWLSIDGRVLFKATVAASETYNTALEHHLRDRLEVRFADRPDADPWKPPVRETSAWRFDPDIGSVCTDVLSRPIFLKNNDFGLGALRSANPNGVKMGHVRGSGV